VLLADAYATPTSSSRTPVRVCSASTFARFSRLPATQLLNAP
jgi:hypothetical protein